MDYRKNFGDMEECQQQITELFKGLVPTGVFETWVETFEIESIDSKKVIITYNGTRDIKEFKDECRETLQFCVYSVIGVGYKLKIVERNNQVPSLNVSTKTRKNFKAAKFFAIGMIFVCMSAAIIVILCNYIGNRSFRESFYSVSSIKVDKSFRVIQVSDLHGCSYGKDNKSLITRIEELNPDVIICTGDIVDAADEDIGYAENLAEKLSEIAPSYYVYGNNEVESIYDFALNQRELDENFGFNDDNRDETALNEVFDTFEEALEATGIKVLKNQKDTIEIKGMKVDIYGILTSNPSSFWSYTANSFSEYIYEDTDNIKITAVHEPFIFEEFQPDTWGDLVVCGHTHGGVIRVPILGPLFTKEGGIFPERKDRFVYGRYDTSGSPLIVSGGLENKNVLRLNNQPELVVIDINKF